MNPNPLVVSNHLTMPVSRSGSYSGEVYGTKGGEKTYLLRHERADGGGDSGRVSGNRVGAADRGGLGM